MTRYSLGVGERSIKTTSKEVSEISEESGSFCLISRCSYQQMSQITLQWLLVSTRDLPFDYLLNRSIILNAASSTRESVEFTVWEWDQESSKRLARMRKV